MLEMNRDDKMAHQVKARWYYIFWAIMTVSVVCGQLYVGHSYRTMSNSLQNLIDSAVVIK